MCRPGAPVGTRARRWRRAGWWRGRRSGRGRARSHGSTGSAAPRCHSARRARERRQLVDDAGARISRRAVKLLVADAHREAAGDGTAPSPRLAPAHRRVGEHLGAPLGGDRRGRFAVALRETVGVRGAALRRRTGVDDQHLARARRELQAAARPRSCADDDRQTWLLGPFGMGGKDAAAPDVGGQLAATRRESCATSSAAASARARSSARFTACSTRQPGLSTRGPMLERERRRRARRGRRERDLLDGARSDQPPP